MGTLRTPALLRRARKPDRRLFFSRLRLIFVFIVESSGT
jgi:hypothetical protein